MKLKQKKQKWVTSITASTIICTLNGSAAKTLIPLCLHMLLVFFNRYRSSRPEVFCKKGVLRNFAKFTGKHLRQSLFFNQVASACNFIKKRLWRRCFPVNFAQFLRTPFSTEHLWWLLLNIIALETGVCECSLELKNSFIHRNCDALFRYTHLFLF